MSDTSPVFSSEPGLTNQFPAFETTPWDISDLLSILQSSTEQVERKPDSEHTHNQTNSSSGSEDKTHNRTGLDLVAANPDDLKQRRKISNRESARRSRMRKQTHLENLGNQLNRLRVDNRELKNRLLFVQYHCHRVLKENDRLRLEHGFLRQKLLNIRKILTLRQIQHGSTYATWPCNNSNVNVIATELNPSIISNHVI